MNQPLQAKPKQQKKQQLVDQNPIEAIRDIGSGVKQAGTDFAKDSFSDMWDQIFGGAGKSEQSSHQKSGDLQEGVEFDLSSLEHKVKELADAEPGIDYKREILHAEAKIASENQQDIKMQVQEIMVELKRIMETSQELAIEFKDVSVMQAPQKAGIYHTHFFAWVLSSLRAARQRVEDSAGWLSAMKGKSNKKGYWGMFKKHGTTFGLSNERAVATQAG
ncbi:MAG TPA: DUF5660 family protein [Candidatus Saccharimonadales bacterium]|nr:DUF5660 family protein [Candidatus Saccharimonadales bacterium]